MRTLPEQQHAPLVASAPVRLSNSTLAAVNAGVERPAFNPAHLRPGILHLGCGSFHRAHQAWLTQVAIAEEARGSVRSPAHGWGIAAVSLRTPAVTQALAAQDGLYTVLEHSADQIRAKVVGTLRECTFHPAQPWRTRQHFADRAIQLVTLTITVGGYCLDRATGRLDERHERVQGDLHQATPSTAIGLLVEGLQQRRQGGLAPPVVLSCDNLPSNGRVLRQMCIDYAALKDDRLSEWIARHVQFPCTMVDRIVPATGVQDVADARAALGLLDAVPVPAESFHQWVIERFDGPRPRWQAAGAEYVGDVAPWEASKLRLLNGGHLVLASLGQLAGCATVAEVMAQAGFAAFMNRFFVHEQKPTLPPSDHDIRAYARQLIARFCNPGIAHRLERIARDSAPKLQARLLDALRQNLQAGRPAPCTVLALAAWMRCAAGQDAGCAPAAPDGPLAQRLRQCGEAAAKHPERLGDHMLQLTELFGEDLRGDAGLRAALRSALAVLASRGVHAAVAQCLAEERPWPTVEVDAEARQPH